MADFTANPWTKPFGKMSIFRLFELLVFIAQKVAFSFQNIIQHIFLACTSLKEKKKANYATKPWTKPLGKMSIFRLFELESCFFRSRIAYNTFSSPILPKKQKLEKWPILHQNHSLTTLKKCHFFDFLNFLFLQFRKLVFPSRILYNTFSWPVLS